jgi:hypothetical protein
VACNRTYPVIIALTLALICLTLLAGKLFASGLLSKDKNAFSPADQATTGKALWAAGSVLAAMIVLVASSGDIKAVENMRLLAAFITGGIFSCAWFGWYLAIALAYNGHNTEVGGAARSESYKHLIRFKLTQTNLTGYVIGIDEPIRDFKTAHQPKFRLVDVFTIHVP